jgi:hypothetical protein
MMTGRGYVYFTYGRPGLSRWFPTEEAAFEDIAENANGLTGSTFAIMPVLGVWGLSEVPRGCPQCGTDNGADPVRLHQAQNA